MHHHLTPAGELARALLFGGRVALIYACLGMVVIFWPQATRHFTVLLGRGRIVFADQLGAGIWLTALGIILGASVMLTVSVYGHLIPTGAILVSFAVFVILVGYVFYVQAWASVARWPRLPLCFIAGLVLAFLGGMAISLCSS